MSKRFVAAALAALTLALPLAAQQPDADARLSSFARELLSTVGGGRGDAFALRALELAKSETQHPLAEIALELAWAERENLADPAAFDRALSTLDPASFDAPARARLATLQAFETLVHTPAEALTRERDRDWFPDHLSRFRLLAPLIGPDPSSAGLDLASEASYASTAEHARALRGRPALWIDGQRSAALPFVQPDSWVEPIEGCGLLCFEFEHPAGGAGYVEIDTRGSDAARTIDGLAARGVPWTASVHDPRWWLSIDDAPPLEIDPVAAEQPRRMHVPASFRAGANRIAIFVRLGAGASYALRILDARGEIVRVRPLARSSALGSRPAASASAPAAFEDGETRLRRAASSPYARALLGLHLCLDERAEEGVELLRGAMEAVPDDARLALLYARWLSNAPYLPDVWKRARARAIWERLSTQAELPETEIALARALVREDQEEDSIRHLQRAVQLEPRSPAPWTELSRVYPRLEMTHAAESALGRALSLAPADGQAQWLAAQSAANQGLLTRATQLVRERMRARGAFSNDWSELAGHLSDAGDVVGALAALEQAALRGDHGEHEFENAHFLALRGRVKEADQLFADLARAYPLWSEPVLERAHLARRAGDGKRERELLAAVLEREPAHLEARERWKALTGGERTEELFARYRADREQVLAGYDRERWKDSVVRVLDSQVVRVFRDGSQEVLTHEIVHVKDLQGCEREGTQRLGERVERIATIKAQDGRELEPVAVEHEYVMPSLQPGDMVERAWREQADAPERGIERLNNWFFASVEEPFFLSRWVVILPRGMELELKQGQFDGKHEIIEDGDDVVHVFEARERDRVEPEPGAPSTRDFLPWVAFGRTLDVLARAKEQSFEELRLATHVTAEIRAAAAEHTRGLQGDLARARALYAFVREHIREPDTSSTLSATASLLAEEGNPAHLYLALLEAAGVPAEMVWSRDRDPAGDPDRGEPFPSPTRWQGRLLVRVLPRDAQPSWCDLTVRGLPYGELLGNAPRAEALAKDGVRELPPLELEQRVGSTMTFDFEVAADLSAKAKLRISSSGNAGYVGKDRLRETPEAQRKALLTRVFGQLVPRFELESFATPGLETSKDDQPLALEAQGRVKSFLDETASGLTLKLPFPPVQLGASLAGGEGERHLDYVLPSAIVSLIDARITLPAGMHLVDAPPRTLESFADGRFELTIEAVPSSAGESRSELHIVRKLLVPPFRIPAAEYGAWSAFCAKVDEVERVPLRLAR